MLSVTCNRFNSACAFRLVYMHIHFMNKYIHVLPNYSESEVYIGLQGIAHMYVLLALRDSHLVLLQYNMHCVIQDNELFKEKLTAFGEIRTHDTLRVELLRQLSLHMYMCYTFILSKGHFPTCGFT